MARAFAGAAGRSGHPIIFSLHQIKAAHRNRCAAFRAHEYVIRVSRSELSTVSSVSPWEQGLARSVQAAINRRTNVPGLLSVLDETIQPGRSYSENGINERGRGTSEVAGVVVAGGCVGVPTSQPLAKAFDFG